MKLARPVLAVAVGAGLVLSGTAGAVSKPKPVCNLVTDPSNDTFLVRDQEIPGAYGPQEDALDIISADLATNAKQVTAVIRVKKLATTIATGRAQGYELEFTNDGPNTLYLAATVAGDTATFSEGYRDPTANNANSLGTPTGVVDLAKSEIRITGLVADFASQGSGLKPGKTVTMGEVTSARNVVAANVFADAATSDKTYKTGAPSCVVVGK